MTRWVCTYCIATKGLRGSDLQNWPDVKDSDAQAAHIEGEHHIPVRRDHESEHQCVNRFKREQPEAGGPNCKCPSCRQDPRYAMVDALRGVR